MQKLIIEVDDPIDLQVLLPLIKKLNYKFKIEDTISIEERNNKLKKLFAKLNELGTFGEITDPVAWQREIRKDKPLFGRKV